MILQKKINSNITLMNWENMHYFQIMWYFVMLQKLFKRMYVWYFSIYVWERAKWKYGFAGSSKILKLRKTKVRRPSFANIS